MELNEILAQLRIEHGLKQLEIAELIHVEKSTVSNYESGKAVPSYPVMIKIADYYQVSLDYLFGRTQIRTSIANLERGMKTTDGRLSLDDLLSLDAGDRETIQRMIMAMKANPKYQKRKSQGKEKP